MSIKVVKKIFCISLSMLLFINLVFVSSSATSNVKYGKFAYGKSGLNRKLVYNRLSYAKAKNPKTYKVLLVFEVHGFEDSYYKDGRVLVDIANKIVSHYKNNISQLKNTELYVVPQANPDGLLNGTSNYGKGRCQVSLGIDINRDFDYYYKKFSNSRNYTLYKPFGSPEARGLKSLIENIKPNIVIDFHGWESKTIGNSELSRIFNRNLGLYTSYGFSSNCTGYLSAWASRRCGKALLVEYPPSCTYKTSLYSDRTIEAINDIVR